MLISVVNVIMGLACKWEQNIFLSVLGKKDLVKNSRI